MQRNVRLITTILILLVVLTGSVFAGESGDLSSHGDRGMTYNINSSPTLTGHDGMTEVNITLPFANQQGISDFKGFILVNEGSMGQQGIDTAENLTHLEERIKDVVSRYSGSADQMAPIREGLVVVNNTEPVWNTTGDPLVGRGNNRITDLIPTQQSPSLSSQSGQEDTSIVQKTSPVSDPRPFVESPDNITLLEAGLKSILSTRGGVSDPGNLRQVGFSLVTNQAEKSQPFLSDHEIAAIEERVQEMIHREGGRSGLSRQVIPEAEGISSKKAVSRNVTFDMSERRLSSSSPGKTSAIRGTGNRSLSRTATGGNHTTNRTGVIVPVSSYATTIPALSKTEMGTETSDNPVVHANNGTTIRSGKSGYGGTIGYGQSVGGVLSSPTDFDYFSFTGTEGDIILVRVQSDDSDGIFVPTIEIEGLTNVVAPGEFTLSLPFTGEFDLIVRNEYPDDPSVLQPQYVFYLTKLNPPPSVTPINPGETISGSFSNLLEIVPYSFSAQRGDRLSVTFASECGEMRILTPSGNFMVLSDNITLDDDGTYYLIPTLMFGYSQVGSSYSFTFDVQQWVPGAIIELPFNTTRTGSLNATHGSDLYTFNLSQGDRVFGRLNAGWPAQVTLLDGTGSFLQSSDQEVSYYNYGGNCTFYLLVEPQSEGIFGDYSVYLGKIPLPEDPLLVNYGEVVSGSFSQQLEMREYILNATAGDSIRIWAANGYGGYNVRLYSPLGGQIYIQDPTILPTSGNYTLCVVLNSGSSPGPYSFSVESITSPSVLRSIQYGGIQAGNITNPLQMDIYAFHGTAGDQVTARLRHIPATGPLSKICLFRPDGSYITAAVGNNPTGLSASIPSNGTYYLAVSPVSSSDPIFSYWLSLQNQVIPAEEQEIHGALLIPGEKDIYRFNGQAGDLITARIWSEWRWTPGLSIRWPNGTRVAWPGTGNEYYAGFDFTYPTLPQSGTFYLQVEDTDLNTLDTGNYTVFYKKINQSSLTSLAFNQWVWVPFTSSRQVIAYRYENEGQDTLFWTSTGHNSSETFRTSSGAVIEDCPTLCYPRNPLSVTTPALYYFASTTLPNLNPALVPQDKFYMESFRHRTSTTPIHYNETMQGTSVNQPWQNFFLFNGTTGDKVLARMSSHTYVTSRMYLYRDANASEIQVEGPSYSTETAVQGKLPENGSYIFFRTDHTIYDTVGFATFLTKLNPPPDPTPISAGEVISGTFTRPLEMIPFAYQAKAGDSIRVSFSSGCGDMHLFSPDGNEITIRDPTILLAGGTYHFMPAFRPNAVSGPFSFVVDSFTGPSNFTPIGWNQTLQGSLATALEMDFYSFNGTAGERIAARLQGGWTNSPRISLYRRNGTSVLSSAYGASSAEISALLPENDTYLLVIDDRESDNTGNYSVYLTRLNPPPIATPATCGLVFNGTTTQALEIVPYALSVNAGESFRFWLNSTACTPRLFAPDGTQVPIQDPTVFTAGGTYHFCLAQRPNIPTGEYRFYIESLTRVSPGDARPVSYGGTVLGNLTLAGRPCFYNFTGSAGDIVLARLTVSTSGARLQVHAANGSLLMSGLSHGKWAEANYTLPQDGTYYLSVDDVGGTDLCSYALCLQRLQNPVNGTILPDYAIINGSFHMQAEFDGYNFVADSGDYLYTSMSYPAHTTFLRVYQPNGTLLVDASGCYQGSCISQRLTTGGQYTLIAGDSTGESMANYTLTFENSRPQPLLIGKNLTRSTLTSLWDTYSLDTPAGESLLVRMTPSRAGEVIELYGAFNRVPTESDYDCVQKVPGAQGSYDLLIPTVSGRYYFGVLGKSITGSLPYTLTASTGDQYVSSIYPGALTHSNEAILNIYGLGFENNMEVRLLSNNSTASTAHHVFLSSQTVLVSRFDLSTVSPGNYDLSVRWPGGLKEIILPSVVIVQNLSPGVLLTVPDVNLTGWETKSYTISVPSCQNLFISLQKAYIKGHDTHYGWAGNLSVARNGTVIAYDRSELVPIATGGGGSGGESGNIAMRFSDQDLFVQLVNPVPGEYTIQVSSYEGTHNLYQGRVSGVLTAGTSLPTLPDDQWVVSTVHRNWGSSFHQLEVKPGTTGLRIDTESTGDYSYFRLFKERYRIVRDELGRQAVWYCFGGPISNFTLANPDPGLYIMEFVDTGGVTDVSGNEARSLNYTTDFILGDRDILLKSTMSGQSDPPIRYFPTISRFTPKSGGNGGILTFVINGRWLDPGARVTLTGPDATPITGSDIIGSPDNTTLVARFDLQGRSHGDYTLLVTNPDGTTVRGPFPFTLDEGMKAEFWARIIGREAIRTGRPATYRIEYGNNGSVDMPAIPLGLSSEPGPLIVQFPGSNTWISTESRPVVMTEGPAGNSRVLPAGYSSSIEVQVVTADNGQNTLSVTPYFPMTTKPVYVADQTDTSCPGPGFTLDLSRRYPAQAGTYIGPFGYGWVHSYDIRLEQFGNGQFGILAGDQYLDIFSRDTDGNFTGRNGYPHLTKNPDQSAALTFPDRSIMRFSPAGQPDYYQDINGNRVSFEYVSDRLITVRHSDGDRLVFEYLPSGRISQVTDPANRVTRYTYDGNGTELLTVTQWDGSITGYHYQTVEGMHTLTTIIYPDGLERNIAYDGTGLPRQFSYNDGIETLTLSHDEGNLTTHFTDLTGSSLSYLSTEFGGLAGLRNSGGSGFILRYDNETHPARLTGPMGEEYRYEFDGLGNTVRVVNPINGVLTFVYDPQFSTLSSVRDPRGNSVTFSRDPAGNLAATTFPDGSGEIYQHDARGNLIQVATRNSATIHYTYNTRGLLIRKDFPDGTYATYSYDEHNNLVSAADRNGTLSFLYDASDRLTSVLYPTGYSLNYSYDEGGRVIRRTEQDGFTLNYTYTDNGRLARIADGSGNPVVEYTYDAAGKRTRTTLGSGAYSTYQYNTGGLLVRQVNFDPLHRELSDYTLGYDLSGNLITSETDSGDWNYEYDSEGQLTRTIWPDGHSTRYQYDAAGNRITTTDAVNTTAYTTNSLDQYTAVGDDTLTYDQNGNLLSISHGGDPARTTEYRYGYENQLCSMTSPGGTWEYQYDALGNRMAMTHNGSTIHYLYDPLGIGSITTEYDTTGHLIARFLYGNGLLAHEDAVGNRSYYQFSPNGHTSEVTSSSGDVLNRYRFAPFGEGLMRVEAIRNPFTYVGEYGVMDDGNGLYHMGQRFYNPYMGRFTSNDPVYQRGRNTYIYGGNNPIIRIDPKGRLFWFLAIPAIGYALYKGWNWAKDKLAEKDIAKVPDAQDVALEGSKWVTNPEILTNAPQKISPGGAVVDMATGLLTTPTSLGDTKKEQQDNANNYGNGIVNGFGGYHKRLERRIYQEINGRQGLDPEDKYGPQGYDSPGTPPGEEKRFIGGNEPLEYQAYFWNHENATAPVCDVEVYDVVDPDLEPSSFRFTETGFSDWTVKLDPCQFFMVYVDTRPKMDYIVRIIGVFNQTTGVANLTYNTLDPNTLVTPDDPIAGFLPPISDSGKEIGWFNYQVLPAGTPPTGTEITNQAFINFDNTTFLPGPKDAPWKNTIDSGDPISSLSASLSGANQVRFEAAVNDDAGGSGVRDYTVFISDNGGEYLPWLNTVKNTTQSITVVPGHEYRYYSIARDNVGNQEGVKGVPDGSIIIPYAVTADFTGSPLSGPAPLDVNFSDLSTGSPTGWQWNFGDGSANASAQHPHHTFAAPGNYTVTLTARNGGSASTLTKGDYVRVSEPTGSPLAASFIATPVTGYAPLTVRFNDTSTGMITAWNWSFDSGANWTNRTDPLHRNITHTFGTAGGHTVILEVRDGTSKVDRADRTITVLQPTFSITSVTPSKGTIGATVSGTIVGVNLTASPVPGVILTKGSEVITATNVKISGTKKIMCKFAIPLGATTGAWDLGITKPGGETVTMANAFTVNPLPAPKISSVSPTSGFTNSTTTFSLSGSNFIPGSTVTFSRPGYSIEAVPDPVTKSTRLSGNLTLNASVPSGKWSIRVMLPDGRNTTKADAFMVNPWPKPTFTRIFPGSGNPNMTYVFTLTGNYFKNPDTVVTLTRGGPGEYIPTILTSVSQKKTTGIFSIPSGASIGKWNVTITTPDGGSFTKKDAFEVKRWPAPTISTITPRSGLHGTTVAFTLTGNNFQPGSSVNLTTIAVPGVNMTTSLTLLSEKKITGTLSIPSDRTGKFSLEVECPDGNRAVKNGAFTVT